MRIVSACRTACFRGLIRESDIEIGFDPCMAAQSAVFLIDWIPKALGFRRSRMDTDCVRLPDCLFWWTDSGIGPRDRIRYEENTGISVCLAARPADFNRRTAGFRRFRMNVDCVRLPNRLFPWTDPEIEHRNRIRYERNTGIDVCPTVRLIGDNRRTLVFRRSRLGTVCGRVLRRTAVRTGLGIRR